MTRNSVAVLLGCLYLAGSAWLVLGEGENYRETRRRERRAAARAETIPPPAPSREQAPVATSTDTPSMPPRTEALPADPPVATVTVQPVTPARVESPPPVSTAALPEAKPKPASTPAMAPAVDRATAAATGPATRPAAADSFWEQPYLKESWNLTHLSTQDEARLGAQLHDLILQLNQRSETGPWQQRVEEAAKPFLKTCTRKDVRYTFTVLESDTVCAFSHPGGYVYVCRGLFNLIGEDEDYALEFAVGHEIAHVDLQHALASLRDPGVMKIPLGTLQKVYMVIIPFAYLDDADFAADRWTYSRMRQSGRSDHKALAFLRKLRGYAEQNGFNNGRVKPKPSAESSLLENHYRAHTATWKRLEQLKDFIATASGPKR